MCIRDRRRLYRRGRRLGKGVRRGTRQGVLTARRYTRRLERHSMTDYRIAVIGGDGIGPEVTTEALKVLAATAERFSFTFQTTEYDLGSDRYLATGEVLPDSIEAELDDHDAILLGAVSYTHLTLPTILRV